MNRVIASFAPILAALALAGAPQRALAQCQSCAQTAASGLKLPTNTLTKTSIPGITATLDVNTETDIVFSMVFNGLPAGLSITNGVYYRAWCSDIYGSFLNNNAQTQYKLYSTYDTAHIPANSQSVNWDKVNWVLNHRAGINSRAVQQVIWRLLTGSYVTLSGYPLPQPDSDNLYNAAVANGAGFVPAAGQVVAVIAYVDGHLPEPTNVYQDLIFEVPMPDCGSGMIGDYVWSDTNPDGLQSSTEFGINNVTVRLTDSTGLTTLATTTTGPVPPGYGYLGPNPNGYYQFRGLCAGNYGVVVDYPQSALSGYIPTVSQFAYPTYRLTDSNGSPAAVNLPTNSSIDESIDFGFYSGAQIQLACAASTGIVGKPYNSALVRTGGVGPFTFSITSGALPAGLSLNPNTGEITGTPTTAGTFTFTAKVVDASGAAAGTTSTNCTIKIDPSPSANCVTIVAIINVPITPVTLVGSGGAGGPYQFSATGLPNGLTMSSGGTISGTPTESGTFNYTVTIKDGAGNTGTVNCSVTVNGGPSANCVTIVAVKGYPITPVTLVGSGGAGAPYQFSATGLPNGLTMSSGGTISGAPTETGTFNYTVTIKDSAGNIGTQNCSVTVNPPPTANCITIVAVKGNPITPVTLVGSGGAGGPYQFSATGLPNGLTMSPGGTISGTPTESGTFNYTVTIKDSAGNIGTQNCSVTVLPPPSANCVVINAIQGVPITPVNLTATGGTGGPYSFSATGLPANLVLSSTGVLSGTATVTGAFSYTVTVLDKDGHVGSFPCSVTVTSQPPNIGLTKTANVSTVVPGAPVTYTYVATNTGGVTLSNVTVVDDAATPGYTADDFTVGSVASLAPQQSASFTITRIPPAQQCMTINNVPAVVGTLITEVLPSGNIRVTYRQSRSVVDNVYGTSATAAAGWPNGHKFGDFTGSDSAHFAFTDKNGVKVLEFYADYLSSALTSKYPSGYGTLGVSGGDGKMVVGSASNILSVVTSMTTNLNQSPAFYGFTTNSPVEPYPGWDYVDSYVVEVSHAAFGAAGFGNVSVVGVHNSPSKLGFNLVTPTPCTADATNTATVTGWYGSTKLTAAAIATVKVTGSGGVTGSIGDLVWYDYNANGVQDAGETGISGATVNLTGAGNATATTDVNGTYQFSGLLAGSYTVCVTPSTLPPGLSQTYDLDGVASPNCATVTLATGQNRLDVDFGYRPTPPIGLTKTPDVNNADIGEPVTYTYQVVNTGSTTLTNVQIVDDNGTPGYTADDFVVATLPSLPPNTPATFTAQTVPPVNMCMLVNNVNRPVGTLTVTQLPNGDYRVIYRQSASLVDNTYGNTASADWPSGHKFSDFTGSDKAEFVFTNGNGDVVLDFFADYLSASTAFPSGYGSLGVSGGDGKMVTGSASNVLSVTTSMSENLNQSSAFYGYTVNSPAPPNAFWDYVDSYTVVVKGSVFGTSGFGSVSVPMVHNSPSKLGVNETDPVACATGTTNIATATAMNGTIPVQTTAKATVVIGVGGSAAGPYTTYKQDQWGDAGKPGGKLLSTKFAAVYPTGVTIGGAFAAQFASAAAVIAFLPQGGGPQSFNKNYVNPTSTNAGELASQVLALRLNADFSEAGVLAGGLADLQVKSGKLTGWTVSAVLQLANQVLGGAALPAGLSMTELKDTVKHINENYENGTNDRGYLY